LSFWKEVQRQYQCEWRAPNSIVDLTSMYVNLRIVERTNAQASKRNSLLNIDFLERAALCD
jgi:hypothetical protein